MAVTIEITVIWYVTPCSLIEKFIFVQTVRHHITGDVPSHGVLHPSAYVTACYSQGTGEHVRLMVTVRCVGQPKRGLRRRCPQSSANAFMGPSVSIIMGISFMICIYHSDGLRAGRPRGWSSDTGMVKNFLHVVQTSSGVHPAPYTMGTGGSFPGGKAAGT
jgi:hypothetical protein